MVVGQRVLGTKATRALGPTPLMIESVRRMDLFSVLRGVARGGMSSVTGCGDCFRLDAYEVIGLVRARST